MNGASEAFRAAILAAMPDADVPEVIEPGRWRRFSTNGRRGDTAGWCKLFDDLRGGVFGCHRQGISETWHQANPTSLTREQRAELARQVMVATVERQAQQRQHWSENARRNAQTWGECVPLTPGDPCALYIERRGFGGVWPLPNVLRLHQALPYWDGSHMLGKYPAMVAPIVAPDGRLVALHRTYLTHVGQKATVPNVKKVTGTSGSLAGACIPLHEPARGSIGIAEGIETALAAWCASTVPTVAGFCAANLAAWQWPASVQRLVIFADNDVAGMDAANTLLARARAAQLRCEVVAPSSLGADWNDVWNARGAVEITS